ncbi:amino acid ABC transporter ATP-binding protein, PAAT family [Amycolatopsis marina]|uniref:Amino acid ABC transporter ATP-binding protein, PAAT family n=1 Tax=Amycolatopsis marina TaxID=490629 RepID=A0A1I1C1X3_9PSEU|nr:amino acid ABC transporter ATP-binding protein [Amycolatopsis marina]SFB56664.1 amino acid ABC transporter ATP-binding protein, PAAT family [Amycolatopsis marina]
MTTTTIELSGICKAFGDLEVLRGVDLSVERGEVVVLMGPSGSGKTTLVRCMNLLEEPDAGHVRICDCAFECGTRRDRRGRAKLMQRARQRTGMVFQQFNLFPHMTALGNVIEGPHQVRKLPMPEAVALGERLLERVGLADKRDVHPSRLSGGQKQRVAIARALAMDPEAVLFDEPTSALDPELHAEVLEVIQELAADGMTMVIVTHETHFAREVANRIVFMDGGVVVEEASPETFFTRPSKERVRSFLRLVDHSGALADAPAPRVGEEVV